MFVQSIFYSCPILIKLEISRQFFEKYSNITFNLLHTCIYAITKRVSFSKKRECFATSRENSSCDGIGGIVKLFITEFCARSDKERVFVFG